MNYLENEALSHRQQNTIRPHSAKKPDSSSKRTQGYHRLSDGHGAWQEQNSVK